MEHGMDFHGNWKLELDDERVLFEYTFNSKKTDMVIIQFDCKTGGVEVFGVQSDFVTDEVSKTRAARAIGIGFVDSLGDQHFISKVFGKFFHFPGEILYID